MKKDIFQRNKEHYIKLKKFCKDVLIACKEAKVKPILYGSFMIFHYTKDKSMKVNDIDLYAKEKDFDKIIKVLKKKKINFDSDNIQKYHTMEISKGNLKVEIDSIDFWNKTKIETIDIDFEGIKTKALSLKSLKKIYKKASETSENNREGNRKKFEILNEL